ncbi:MAG: UvrD-helicase domain-containing protein [Candidatus Marinimicrobia bacterium]|nr:UvrD-helicase domain-containing protein [Candidatus Neomarinimicrobiota bacterium]
MTSSPLERALNVHHSVFIQACAGAGKTFALTKRYAAILDSFAAEARRGADPGDIDPGRILVITFTKKAAGEMASRIYQDTGILLSGREIPEMRAQGIDHCPVLRKDSHPAVREYARYLRESFSRHAIATIDAFCAKVLREFAHRSGLDPQFTVQEEADAAQLLETYLDRWIGQTAGRREPVLTHAFGGNTG